MATTCPSTTAGKTLRRSTPTIEHRLSRLLDTFQPFLVSSAACTAGRCSSTQAWGSSRSSSSAAGAAPSTRDASRAKTILRDAKLIGSVIGAVSTRCAYPRPTRETRLHFLRPRRPQDLGRACMAEVDSRAFLRHPPAMGFDFESISDLIDRFRTHSERELESS